MSRSNKKFNKVIKKLAREYKEITENPSQYYSVGYNSNDKLSWNFKLFGQSETIFEGGIFDGIITFPIEYPNKPPVVKFVGNNNIPILYHPNIYKTGKVCISLLHEGEDQYNYENNFERWLPQHGVNSVLVSIAIMLTEPNCESPANIDAKNEWENDFNSYKKKIYRIVALTQQDFK